MQIALRPDFDPAYRVFSNAMLLKSNDARALVHLTEAGINVVVAGESPRLFLNLLWEKLNWASRVRKEMPQTIKLCPRCIQGAGMYTTMMADNLQCVAGHKVPPAELDEGAQWDRKFWCRNSIWTPKVSLLLFVVCLSFVRRIAHMPIFLF